MACNYHTPRLFFCPDCDGCGAHSAGSGAYSNDPDAVEWTCGRCMGDGTVEMTPERADWIGGLKPYTPSRRRWTGPREPVKSDVLVGMGECRDSFIQQRKQSFGWATSSHYYVGLRRFAMRLVDLPADDVHLLVSPETAAFFNAMNRRHAA